MLKVGGVNVVAFANSFSKLISNEVGYSSPYWDGFIFFHNSVNALAACMFLGSVYYFNVAFYIF